MTHKLVPVLFLAVVACSKRDSTPVAMPQPQPEQETMTSVTPTPEPTPAAEPAPETATEPVVPPTAPPPKMFAAQVELAPLKGQKMKQAVVVKFQQEEGKPATASAESALEGLKAGKYHLVIHEAAECGTDGKKAGKVWDATASAPITIEIKKDEPTTIEASDVAFKLDGDQSIANRTLVMHEDKAGKPGKAVACGVVTKIDVPDPSSTTTGMPAPMPTPPTGGGGGK
jgi:Cu/Zn superoxide dismutase